jgi:hypothetical protein
MKKIIFLTALLFAGLISESQNIYENPNSNWPFLLKEFSSCTIIHQDGNVTKASANYNLLSEELQFQKNNKIMSVTEPEDISEVSFGEITMIYLQENFYILLNKEGDAIKTFKKIKGNMNDLFETEGAYGSSTTTAATIQQSDVNIGGINSMDIRMLWDKQDDGKKFRVNENHFYTTKTSHEIISLKKSNLYNSFPDWKKEIKAFLKENKINLNDDNHIKILAHYLNSL